MKIGIIGGGASGIMAAIEAAKCGAHVTILEKNDRIGKKILTTGNGKCNLSNLSFSDKEYNGGPWEKINKIFEQFSVQDTVSFFETAGLMLKNKNGYLYPLSEQATTVLDVLRYELENEKILVLCSKEVTKITYAKDFSVFCKKEIYHFDRIIVTCGGMASPKTGSDGKGYQIAKQFGHRIIKPVPALVQLCCKETFFRSISGIRTDASLQLYENKIPILTERGELQITDYGISGIPVFQLSRFAAYALEHEKEVTISIDFLPEQTSEELISNISKRYQRQKMRNAEAFFTGILNKKLMLLLMKLHQIKPGECIHSFTEKQIMDVILHFKNFEVTVVQTNGFQNAQVCAGGVSLSEVTDTLESLKQKGLYFAGEILDVDGRCGGYNLQWAWSSGYLAGHCAADQG